MNRRYSPGMTTEIIQIRDVPTEDVAVLRQRAAAAGKSLSAYLREVIHVETSRLTMAEVIARIETREPINATSEDIREFIEEGRRY
jgi:plasmid stability protein